MWTNIGDQTEDFIIQECFWLAFMCGVLSVLIYIRSYDDLNAKINLNALLVNLGSR